VDFTLSIDLSTSWSTSNVTASPTPHNSAIPLNNMETRTPTMWYDAVSKLVRRFGGWPYNAPNPVAEYSFLVNDGIVSWNLDYTGGIGSSSTLPSFGGKTCPGYSLYASSPTTYYSLGGMMTGGTDPALGGLGASAVPLAGLLTYNNQEISWGNASSTAYGGTTFGGGQGFAIAGEGIYVPNFGTAGILVFLGGDAPTSQAIWTEGTSLVLMSEITIYDIGSAQFYTQVASGSTIPSGRTSFCAVGAPSADNATFEMYVFSRSLYVNFLTSTDSYMEATGQISPQISDSKMFTSSHYPPSNGLKPQRPTMPLKYHEPHITAKSLETDRCLV
jgi:hypothetical protein